MNRRWILLLYPRPKETENELIVFGVIMASLIIFMKGGASLSKLLCCDACGGITQPPTCRATLRESA